jgi:hypothetical protein
MFQQYVLLTVGIDYKEGMIDQYGCMIIPF